MFLFALPFAGVGVFMSGLLGVTLFKHHAARSWIEVPAIIEAVELESHRGDDSTTYEVTATYQYTYLNKEYVGTRVGLHGGADNIGSYHQRTSNLLEKYARSGEPYRCFVNPAHPSEALLDRGVRIEMLGFYTLFGVIFGGVGFGLLTGMIWARKKKKLEEGARQQNPEEPWLWNVHWAEGRIPGSAGKAFGFLVVFAVFWNLVSLPLLLVVPAEIREGNHLAALGLLFPLVGLGMIIGAAVAWRRRQKYGTSIFQMASVPGVIGGALSGVVEVPVRVRPEDGYTVALRCNETKVTGSGKQRQTSTTVLWEDQRSIARELLPEGAGRTAVPVYFAIPYTSEPTQQVRDIDWKLSVEAATPGLDFKTSFEVPVFRTPASQADFVGDESAIAPYLDTEEDRDPLQAAGVRQIPGRMQGTRLLFPAGRNVGVALGITVFWVLWSGVVWLLIHLQAPLIFPIVFGLFDLLILLGALDTWFSRSEMEVTASGITVYRVRPLPGGSTHIPLEEVDQVVVKRSMQAGNSLYFNIVAHTTPGKNVVLGKLVKGQRRAQSVADHIEAVLLQYLP